MSPLTLERMEGKASPAGLCPAAGNSGGRQRPLMHFRWVGGWSVCAYVRGHVCVCVCVRDRERERGRTSFFTFIINLNVKEIPTSSSEMRWFGNLSSTAWSALNGDFLLQVQQMFKWSGQCPLPSPALGPRGNQVSLQLSTSRTCPKPSE